MQNKPNINLKGYISMLIEILTTVKSYPEFECIFRSMSDLEGFYFIEQSERHVSDLQRVSISVFNWKSGANHVSIPYCLNLKVGQRSKVKGQGQME